MINPDNCPSVGDKCVACVDIARIAMGAVLEGSREFSSHEIDLEVETSSMGIKTLVNRSGVSEALGCEARQRDAQQVGHKLAAMIIRDQQ